ncbi:helix-turn-helix transcriptional regulator [Paraburkholderia sediminicola]|uniref:helix-turn-helix transcriptional regulator n=1 Tax=Paraburkholderia sediminicola TaxID=458836 RepID=UPI0038B9689C
MTKFFLDIDAVAAAVSLSTRGVQRLVCEGSFPRPRVLSARRVGWLVSEVEAWANARPIADMPPPPSAGWRDS